MNEKVSTQVLIDAFAKQHGVSKKVAEALSKAFFDTVEEGLKSDGVVKVNGLGTFKIVEVGSRESVNVNTGERFLIAGYKKVSLVPEDGLVLSTVEVPSAVEEQVEDQVVVPLVVEEQVEDQVDEPLAVEEQVENQVEEPIGPRKEKIVLEDNVPQNIETPTDEFSGIDLLIATPESIEEVRGQVVEARERAEMTLAAAQDARDELCRLEYLLERLENNVVIEEPAPVDEQVEESAPVEEQVEMPLAVETEVDEQVEEPAAVEEPAPVDEQIEEPVAVEDQVEEEVENDVELSAAALMAKQEDEKIVEDVVEPAVEEPVLSVEEPASPVVEPIQPKPQIGVSRRLPMVEEDDDDRDGMSWWLWVLIPIVGIGLAVAAIYGYKYIQTSQEEEQRLFQERYDAPKDMEIDQPKKVKPAKSDTIKVAGSDSLKTVASPEVATPETTRPGIVNPEVQNPTVKNTEVKKTEVKKEATPKTYVMKNGDYLTRISQKIYGTKDSVQAIIRLNKFADPNNVPIGSTIKLP